MHDSTSTTMNLYKPSRLCLKTIEQSVNNLASNFIAYIGVNPFYNQFQIINFFYHHLKLLNYIPMHLLMSN